MNNAKCLAVLAFVALSYSTPVTRNTLATTPLSTIPVAASPTSVHILPRGQFVEPHDEALLFIAETKTLEPKHTKISNIAAHKKYVFPTLHLAAKRRVQNERDYEPFNDGHVRPLPVINKQGFPCPLFPINGLEKCTKGDPIWNKQCCPGNMPITEAEKTFAKEHYLAFESELSDDEIRRDIKKYKEHEVRREKGLEKAGDYAPRVVFPPPDGDMFGRARCMPVVNKQGWPCEAIDQYDIDCVPDNPFWNLHCCPGNMPTTEEEKIHAKARFQEFSDGRTLDQIRQNYRMTQFNGRIEDERLGRFENPMSPTDLLGIGKRDLEKTVEVLHPVDGPNGEEPIPLVNKQGIACRTFAFPRSICRESHRNWKQQCCPGNMPTNLEETIAAKAKYRERLEKNTRLGIGKRDLEKTVEVLHAVDGPNGEESSPLVNKQGIACRTFAIPRLICREGHRNWKQQCCPGNMPTNLQETRAAKAKYTARLEKNAKDVERKDRSLIEVNDKALPRVDGHLRQGRCAVDDGSIR